MDVSTPEELNSFNQEYATISKKDVYDLVKVGYEIPQLSDIHEYLGKCNEDIVILTGMGAYLRLMGKVQLNQIIHSIVATTYSGHGAPEYTGVDSRDYGNPDAIVADGNISEAKRILTEGGWKDTDGDGIFEKNGMNASFKLYYPSEYLDRQSLAVSFSEQAKEIGIDVELVGTDWDTIYANMYNSAALMQQTSPDPYKSIYQQYHSKEIDNDYMNPNLYNNSNIDSILEKAMSTTDLNEANSLWAQSAYTNGEGFGPNGDAPWVWVATYNYTYFVNEDININIDRPDNLGNDILINIVKWRPN